MQRLPHKAATCGHCGKTFQRREHRDRHERHHTGVKPFVCAVCHKSFSRNDTLVRHRALHAGDNRLIVTRGRAHPHACSSCARLKQRCDGSLPCSRCVLRRSECTYSSLPDRVTWQSESSLDETSDDVAVSPTLPGLSEHTSGVAIQNFAAVPPILAQDLHNHPQTTDHTHWLQDAMPTDAFSVTGDLDNLTWNPPVASFPYSWPMEGLDVIFDVPSPFDMPTTTYSPGLGSLAQQVAEAPNSVESATDKRPSTQSGPPTSSSFHLKPENICGGYTRPCASFPKPQPDDTQMVEAEMFDHISNIPVKAVEGLHRFYASQQLGQSPDTIPTRTLHAFVELYFEHFAWQFPFLHPSRLEAPKLSWMLLLATAAVGSRHSELATAAEYSTVLSDLLARAIETTFGSRMPEIVVIQCTFLLHVLWMFSASHMDKVLLQHKRSSLAARCWDLTCPLQRQGTANIDDEGAWQAWLAEEERLRAEECILALESLGCVFLDNPPVFHLRGVARKTTSSGTDRLWQCRQASTWIEEKRNPSIGDGNQFAFKTAHMELFIQEKELARHIQSSISARSTLGLTAPDRSLHFGQQDPSASTISHANDSSPELPQDQPVLESLASALRINSKRPDTLLHALFILRHVSLDTLQTATGWQTTKEHMFLSKSRFKEFFQRRGASARQCLLYAAQILSISRESQMGACYNVFSIMIAMNYVYCYTELCSPPILSRASTSAADPKSSRPAVVRLDQLQDEAAVKQWIENGAGSLVRLTGVGVLDGAGACVRFLRDVERNLHAQIAWHGLCRAFAGSFAQLRRGETPTRGPVESGHKVSHD
ncbi:SCAN domain-containing zinc finger protein [Microdochium nivale]|nr:SCAN domain-containing zinc finger protein [Microdochium nivale]